MRRLLTYPARAALVLAVLATALQPAAAEERDAALTFSGDVVVAVRGACREVFPQCGAGAESFPVLALDLLSPGKPTRRVLVPETLGPEAEGIPAILVEDASNSIVVVWESKLGAHQSRLNLASLEGSEWSEVIEISGDTEPLRGSPQVAVTRDQYLLARDGGEAPAHQRTVLHVLWWEKTASGEEVFYSPVIFVDGRYLGLNQVYDLTQLDTNPLATETQLAASGLVRSPRLDMGRNGSSVVIGFMNPATQRFLTFEAQVLPAELSELADTAEAAVVANAGLYDQGRLVSLADRVRSQMIEFGVRFQPGQLASLINEVSATISTAASHVSGGALSLADRVRSQMIEFGARAAAGDTLISGPPERLSSLLETPSPPLPGGATLPPHSLRLRLVTDRPAPGLTADGPSWLFLSENAQRAIVAWEEEGSLRYYETRGMGWTAVRQIALDGPIDAARAEQILRQRIREH